MCDIISKNPMNIIISNDDGVQCEGIIKLAEQLSKKHNVLVVAPDGNRSASSHSLTISKTIKLNTIEKEGYSCHAISGTPADCVKFAKLHFSDFKADIVVAGINKGHNIGTDILYSGTVSIACEASFFGNVAFAFSAFSLEESDFTLYAELAEKIIEGLLPFSEVGDVWNINFPDRSTGEIKGYKITGLGKQLYSDRYVEVKKNEFQLVGEIIEHDQNHSDCDIEWIKKGYITITPILLNKTNFQKIEKVKEKCKELL